MTYLIQITRQNLFLMNLHIDLVWKAPNSIDLQCIQLYFSILRAYILVEYDLHQSPIVSCNYAMQPYQQLLTCVITNRPLRPLAGCREWKLFDRKFCHSCLKMQKVKTCQQKLCHSFPKVHRVLNACGVAQDSCIHCWCVGRGWDLWERVTAH